MLLHGLDAFVQQSFQILRLDALDCVFTGDQPLLGHVDRYLHSSLPAPLARPGLQDVQSARFNSELNVLHVVEMTLQITRNAFKFSVDLRHRRTQLFNWRRRPAARDQILTLGPADVLSEQVRLSRAGVAGEHHPCSRPVIPVSHDHRLHHSRSAYVPGYVVETAILHCPEVVP